MLTYNADITVLKISKLASFASTASSRMTGRDAIGRYIRL